MDVLEDLTDVQLIELSAEIEVQLEAKAATGTRPVIYLLAMQRRRAAKAVIGLLNVEPTDVETIRGFQQEAALYHDLIENCREMLNRGKEADRSIGEAERFALNEAIEGMSEEERRLLNVEPKGED